MEEFSKNSMESLIISLGMEHKMHDVWGQSPRLKRRSLESKDEKLG